MEVCKDWYEYAAPVFYKHVEVIGNRPTTLKLQWSSRLELRYGQYTKTISIKYDRHWGLGKETVINTLESHQLLYLLQHMPNVKIVNFGHSEHKQHYMAILRDAPEGLQLLPHVEHIKLDNGFIYPRQRESVFRQQDEDYDTYFAVYWKFRESLSHLIVHYYHDFAQYYLGIFGLIGHFPNLTGLQFYNAWRDNLTLFDILSFFPNLTSLKFVCDFMGVDEAQSGFNSFLEYYQQNGEASSLAAHMKNLRTLYIAVPLFDGSYMDYIIDHCPVNMEDL